MEPEATEHAWRIRMPIPLVGGKIAVIELPPEMSEQAWKQMIAWLDVLKPSFVTGESAQRT